MAGRAGTVFTISNDSQIYAFYTNPSGKIALAGGQQYQKKNGSINVPMTSAGGQVTNCSCPAQYTEITYRYTEDGADWKKGEVVKFCLFTPEETSN